VLAGDVIADPEALGLDVMFPAFFLTLLVTELRRPGGKAAAAIGAAIALVLVPFTPPGVPVMAASLGALVGLRRPAGKEPSGD
jgi:predicted branched-subunit amino acid permease